jgi:hypothetical protein
MGALVTCPLEVLKTRLQVCVIHHPNQPHTLSLLSLLYSLSLLSLWLMNAEI